MANSSWGQLSFAPGWALGLFCSTFLCQEPWQMEQCMFFLWQMAGAQGDEQKPAVPLRPTFGTVTFHAFHSPKQVTWPSSESLGQEQGGATLLASWLRWLSMTMTVFLPPRGPSLILRMFAFQPDSQWRKGRGLGLLCCTEVPLLHLTLAILFSTLLTL